MMKLTVTLKSVLGVITQTYRVDSQRSQGCGETLFYLKNDFLYKILWDTAKHSWVFIKTGSTEPYESGAITEWRLEPM